MHNRSRLGLILAVALLLAPAQRAAVQAQENLPGIFVGRFTWTNGDPAFGGLSGIDLDADGLGFVTLSDRGSVFAGRLARDDAGAVAGAEIGPAQALRDPRGRPLTGNQSDAEGIALLPDGRFWVSFEQQARVVLYDRPGAAGKPGPTYRTFAQLQANGSLEALAVDAQGRLYTMPEEPYDGEADTPVWRMEGSRWSEAFRITRDGRWKPVGADFGPDGNLYLLERAFWPPFGFQSRVRRFNPEAITPGPNPGQPILGSRVGQFDNLESIAVWQDATGAIRLTMVSDDNFLAIQRTELVDYRLTSGE